MTNQKLNKLERELFKLGYYDQAQGNLKEGNFKYVMTEISKNKEAIFYFDFSNMKYRIYLPKK